MFQKNKTKNHKAKSTKKSNSILQKHSNPDKEGDGVVEEGVGEVGHGVGGEGESPPGVR